MARPVPHPIPYQGSKRHLAPEITQYFPRKIDIFFEPFAGSAAVTLYAARYGLARRFVLGDILPELIDLWREILFQPERTAARYEAVWRGHIDGGTDYFNSVRERFNRNREPVDLLYLLVRCVKNAVRFNRSGDFTQSADKRRLGTQPAKMATAILAASTLLKGKVELHCGDFTTTIQDAGPRDLIYMDPPYEGTTQGRDKRYFQQLERGRLIEALNDLNTRNVPFLLSYDGETGGVAYAPPLPGDIGMQRLLLNAGRSSQATLSGRDAVTLESLYLSKEVSELFSRSSEERGIVSFSLFSF